MTTALKPIIGTNPTLSDTHMMLSLALSTLGLQPGRLPLTRTLSATTPTIHLQLARLDVEGTNVEVLAARGPAFSP